MAFDELARRHGDFAMVGAAVRLMSVAGGIEEARICFHSVGATPVRATGAEAALTGRPANSDAIRAAQNALSQDLDPADDVSLPGSMRLHLARILLGRILSRLTAQMP